MYTSLVLKRLDLRYLKTQIVKYGPFLSLRKFATKISHFDLAALLTVRYLS